VVAVILANSGIAPIPTPDRPMPFARANFPPNFPEWTKIYGIIQTWADSLLPLPYLPPFDHLPARNFSIRLHSSNGNWQGFSQFLTPKNGFTPLFFLPPPGGAPSFLKRIWKLVDNAKGSGLLPIHYQHHIFISPEKDVEAAYDNVAWGGVHYFGAVYLSVFLMRFSCTLTISHHDRIEAS